MYTACVNLCGVSTFFVVVAMHMTVHDVCVTQTTKLYSIVSVIAQNYNSQKEKYS